MGAILEIIRLYRIVCSVNVKPPRILSPLSRLPRNSPKPSSFRVSFPSECSITYFLPIEVVIANIPEL